MSARRDSWWDESARARPDACRCGWRAAPARPPSPARPANPPPSARQRTAACAAGPAGDRCTGWSGDRPAGRPARRFAGARMCLSTCGPWAVSSTRMFFFVTGSGSLRFLPFNPVFQHPDLLDFKLDRIAMFQIPADFQSAAIADRAGANEFAGHQCLVLGHVLDDLLERKQHAVGNPLRTHLAIDADFHLQVVGIADLVGRHDPGSHDIAAVKTLAFGGAK